LSPESRSHPRAPLRLRVWCEGDRTTLYVQAVNASMGGMFIKTANPEVGAYRVSFTDLEDGQVVANVETVWIRADPSKGDMGMGVRIVDFERGADAYHRFIERHLRAVGS
jgi:hypothetical protein